MSEANEVQQQPEVEVNSRRSVVSSENSNDFYAEKLGLANEEETSVESEQIGRAHV